MPSNEALKQRLVAEYEGLLDDLLARRKPDDEITLDEIEQMVMEASAAMSGQLLAALTEVREWEQPPCPGCGGKTHYKGQRSKQVVTVSGEVAIRSAYYYCPACQAGFSPSA